MNLTDELESRGLRFARYADDCNIYVKSKRAGERVLAKRDGDGLDKKLRLKVNQVQERRGPTLETQVSGIYVHDAVASVAIAPAIQSEVQETCSCRLTKRNRGSSFESRGQRTPQLPDRLAGLLSAVCQTPIGAAGLG